MKKFIKTLQIFALLATVSFDAIAEKPDYRKACRTTGELAESMMIARQAGVSLDEAMEKTMKIYPKGDLMLLDAYSRPRWNTKKMQDRAVKEFKNEILVTCYRLISE